MALKKFPDIRRFAWESTKIQKWNTSIQKSASGKVRTMTNQLYPEWTITASLPAITDAEASELLGFVALIRGAYEPFLWLDPEDNSAKGIRLIQIDGAYQCVMPFGDYREPAEFVDNAKVYIDGKEADCSLYSIADGAIEFIEPPPLDSIITADYTYYWKVMLDDDGLEVTKVFDNINKVSLKMAVAR